MRNPQHASSAVRAIYSCSRAKMHKTLPAEMRIAGGRAGDGVVKLLLHGEARQGNLYPKQMERLVLGAPTWMSATGPQYKNITWKQADVQLCRSQLGRKGLDGSRSGMKNLNATINHAMHNFTRREN